MTQGGNTQSSPKRRGKASLSLLTVSDRSELSVTSVFLWDWKWGELASGSSGTSHGAQRKALS